MNNQHHHNLEWVQVLRGVAALLVVLTHARYALQGTDNWPMAERLFLPGAMGVDLFFLISGFIMCYSTAGSDGSPSYVARFAIKRFARVWPVYVALTFVVIFALYGGVDYFHTAANRLTFWHSIGMLPADPRHPPYFGLTLQLGWTLEFEMYFYLVFAASMLFRRLRWFVLGAWAVLTVFLVPLARRGFDMDVTLDLGYARLPYLAIVTSPFVLEFMAGVLVGWLYLQPWFRLPKRQLAWHVAGLTTAFAAWAVYGGLVHTHGPLDYGWPLALMMAGLALSSKTVRLPAPPFLLWLGSISYSLYLTHLMTQQLLINALNGLDLPYLVHAWGFIFISTAVALSVAALSYRCLEQGLSEAVRRGLMRLVPGGRPALQVVQPERPAREA